MLGVWQLVDSFHPQYVFIVDGVTILTLADAYNHCAATSSTAGFKGCEIWDYSFSNGIPEFLNAQPWPNDGSEAANVHVHLGPGTIDVCEGMGDRHGLVCGTGLNPSFCWFIGSGVVEGAGRSNSSGTFGTRIVAGSAFAGCATGEAAANPTPANAVVVIGDVAYSGGIIVSRNTFGSRLTNVTVDANFVQNASCLEFQNAQEQSGIEHVNCVNYSRFGIWVHGLKSNNAHIIDSEVNGCLASSTACLISNATVPVEIDNTIFRSVDGLTVNATNTQSAPVSTTPGAITCASGIVTLVPPGTMNFSLLSGLAFAPGTAAAPNYINVTNLGMYNGIFPINSVSGSPINQITYSLQPSVSCSSSSTTGMSGAAVALVPNNAIILCSLPGGAGTNYYCADQATTSPMGIKLTQVHVEHSGYAILATGASTSVNIDTPTLSPSSNYNGVHIDSNTGCLIPPMCSSTLPGATEPWTVRVTNLV